MLADKKLLESWNDLVNKPICWCSIQNHLLAAGIVICNTLGSSNQIGERFSNIMGLCCTRLTLLLIRCHQGVIKIAVQHYWICRAVVNQLKNGDRILDVLII